MEQNQIPTPPIEAQIPADDPTAPSLFDWSDFLDFNVDEGLHPSSSLPHSEQEQEEQAGGSDPAQEKPGAVRKRDPRLLCSNFLARVPCACPELDAKLAEEERQLPSKKRTRVARGPSGPARCQVPGCEDDISELKGYHKRHRVCLRCANAVSVVIDGEAKRYCQQCGKFHVLSDFDEGKRSCRRKLERHNNRRRRKPHDSKEGAEKESQPIILADDLSGDDDAGKDGISVNGQIEEKELLLESDGQVSVRGSQNLQSDNIVSLSTSGEPHAKADTQDPTFKQSPPYCDNKSSFSSACPAGRISFKLYDWNPAEFPRRLRLQIFQWLASMPVELEGYIRPGCTILTAFIAMPEPVWRKLLEEPALCIKNLVSSPGSLLSGRGAMHVYLNDMIFRITKDATLVHEVKVKYRAPKLHYIYPNCFEAGRPMEFVACGSHLLQPNFRFLISFAGQYLAYKIRVSSPCEGHANSADHQLLKIYVPQIDIALSGPGFVEVENQSGLSNFIPVLVGDKETCAEMVILQQKSATLFSSSSQELECSSSPRPACEVLTSRQAEFSEFVLDVAWLLKKPASKQKLTSSHILRLNCLLKYLMEKESTVVLDGLCCSLRTAMDNDLVDSDSVSDLRLLQKNMNTARRRLAPRSHQKVVADTPTPSGNCCSHSSANDASSLIPSSNLGLQRMVKKLIGLVRPRPSLNEDTTTVPLLQDEVIMNIDLQDRPSRSWSSRTLSTWRLLVMAVMAVGVCFGVCAVVVHPQRVGRITSTIHSCLFDNSGR